MRRLAPTAAAAAAALASATAYAGDPADIAQRARRSVEPVFAHPEFEPLADADVIRLPRIESGSWIDRLLRSVGEFTKDVLKALDSLVGDFFRWVFRGIGKLFSGGGASDEPLVPEWVGWAFVVVAAGLLGFLVVRLVRSAQRERAARAASTFLVPAHGAGEDDALARTPEEWRRSARELAAGGARRDAIRALYLALLASLHRAGAIRYDRTRTNTAYVGDVDRAHPAHAPFLSITLRFDAAWYGGHDPAADDVGAANDEAARVLRAFREEAALV